MQPGFRMTDAEGQIYQIEVDPPSNPEMASGAEIIGTAFYHAIGYNVVDVYLAEIDRDALVIADGATIRDPLNGRRRQMKKYDLDNVFNRAARLKNGHYRVLVSRFASGKPLGNFRYYGTRPDDPERHRPARAPPRAARRARLRRVAESRRLARHQQPGHARDGRTAAHGSSTTCSTSGRFWAAAPSTRSVIGRATNTSSSRSRDGSRWPRSACTSGRGCTIDYPDVPKSVGRLEADAFRSREVEAGVSQPGVRRTCGRTMRSGRRASCRSSPDEAIRAVVEKAAYTDPAATDFMTKTIIARRDKVVATWLNQVCPVVDTTLSADGTLAFTNAAVEAKAATAPERYELNWFRFDNATDQRTPVGEAMRVTAGSARMPNGLTGDFVGVSITAVHAQQPGWANPSTFFFRRASGGWSLVGVERGAATSAPTIDPKRTTG